MRCTTELLSNFALDTIDAHVFMVETDLDAGVEPEDYFDAMTVQIEEGNHFDDALDMVTVRFDSVVEDLSMELFNQDLAEDRAYEDVYCECDTCGKTDDWDYETLTRIGAKWFCANHIPAQPQIIILQEVERKRQARALDKRFADAKKFNEALVKAKEIAPHLDWARYENDPRKFPTPMRWW